MKHPSARLVLAATVLSVLGCTAAAASAGGSDSGDAKSHVICVINQDPDPNGEQDGLCVVLDDAEGFIAP